MSFIVYFLLILFVKLGLTWLININMSGAQMDPTFLPANYSLMAKAIGHLHEAIAKKIFSNPRV